MSGARIYQVVRVDALRVVWASDRLHTDRHAAAQEAATVREKGQRYSRVQVRTCIPAWETVEL